MKAYTKEKLEALLAKHQRVLTLDDVDAIVELDAIAAKISGGSAIDQDGDYFEIDGHFFKRPTFARQQLTERLLRKFNRYGLASLCVMYALDLNRTEQEINGTPTFLSLVKYAATLDVGITRAMAVIRKELDIDESDDGADGDTDEGTKDKPIAEDGVNEWTLFCMLSAEVGGSPEEWADATNQKLTAGCDVLERRREHQAALAGAKARPGPPKDTLRIRAIVEFRDRLKKLEATWQAS